MTEALPAGLLPQMSRDLGVSEAVTGQTITVYAIGTMLTAIPVALLTVSWPRRQLLVTALAGFVVANLATAVFVDFTVIMTARFVAGASSGIICSLLGGYAARLVRAELKGRAMAIAMAGTPVALSLGVPLGAVLGKTAGWHVTFGCVALLSGLLIVWTIAKLPNFAGQKAEDHVPFSHVLRLPGLRTVLVVTGAYVLAHTILYTYIAPLLAAVGLDGQVQWILLDFGIASIASIGITGALIDRHHRSLALTSTALFAAAASALAFAANHALVDYGAVAAWGLAFGGSATILQSALMRAAGPHADVAQSSMVTTWNFGIGASGLVGGVLLAGFGTAALTIAAIALLAPATLIVVLARNHAFPQRLPYNQTDQTERTSR